MREPVLDDLAHYRLATEIAGMDVPELCLPEHHDVVIGRMRLHYLDWGTADRPPIVFLHGGGLTAHTWDLICLALRADYHCLALDQRGHGDSEWSPELHYGPEAHLADLEGFIDRLGPRDHRRLRSRRPVAAGGRRALTAQERRLLTATVTSRQGRLSRPDRAKWAPTHPTRQRSSLDNLRCE